MKKPSLMSPRQPFGFTLIELVMVIVLLGVLGIATSQYISQGAQIYSQSASYQSLISQGRFALDRLQRELRASLPNSVRYASYTDDLGVYSTQCIEFLPVVASSSYIDAPVYPANASAALKLVSPNFDPGNQHYVFAAGDQLAVYVLNAEDAWEACDASSDIVSICELSDIDTETAAEPISAKLSYSVRFALDSPSSRYFITRGQTQYCVFDDRLRRNDNGGDSDSWVTMAEGLSYASGEQPFEIEDTSLTRNSLVQVYLPFADDDDFIEFSHEIHIPNQP